MQRLIFWVGLIALSLYHIKLADASGAPSVVSNAEIQKVNQKYGMLAANRLKAWQNLVNDAYGKPERLQLSMVNNFFNGAKYVSDEKNWGKPDYWATPIEMLIKDAGDCEDYVIAKYFTLRALGISDQKLYLTYVKAIRLKQAHMVLTYFKTPKSIPLVLDNLNTQIRKATQRPDLLPIYSFNGSGLWLAKQRGNGQAVEGGNKQLEQWQALLKKLDKRSSS
ncbi:transglutaminase-like cysteine peptidase [Hydrogenovibrio marinus]|uniref:Sulfate adenylyltransferase n=1 Tax=Hydrogenovibrio marinus TaxID=28885 RepID=A0A066ZPV1_HYDMR|nr:transglutaminase-like cysteine peptidase [Hydrogenovibrio marinus]KDN95838.1 hypothetical protein EI16_05960 [Hydrogenovibrio marinus]BBN58675.1 sulfate adenylyltransferase [Hydrogenovibrio marinus]